MTRTKIDYGIDLGTTNSAISRIENGEPTIKKTDTLKDTMPSSVYINKRKAMQVGDSAFNALKKEMLKSMKSSSSANSNAFIEFKRTMGTDKKYYSSNLGKELSSEELSAEVLKTLKSFIKDENFNSVVITVPAAFKSNQIDATRRAGKLAGFNHIEVLQEPVAASMAYGLSSKNKNGYWLVFDFGGGTFDAALLKVEEGIMQVIDTEGDNYLGGKDLDFAIVDEIIMPYLKDNYEIDSILGDNRKKQILRNAMKFYAEETKIKLSFNDTHNILSDIGDIPGEDDDGEEFELDILVTQKDIANALSPVFQKAIDLSKRLLKRSNLSGSSLDSLILVGGPTFSPVLRKMLEEQICKPDISVDPMTVVAKGAALFASTIDVSEEVREQTRDKSKIQLGIEHEASTVEDDEFVTIKILKDKTEGFIPNEVFAEIIRGDKAWSSGKIEINTTGEVIDVQLKEGITNVFEIVLYDNRGNVLENEPKSFNIIQGSVVGAATLPYNVGIEVKDRATGKIVFTTVTGLEKNKSLPAIGTLNGLKTQKQIRPGMEKDFIKIPIYQGEHGAEGSRAIYNEHVYDIIINGNDLPTLLPENSDVDLTINIDRSQKISVQAYFPYLDDSAEIEVPEGTIQSIETVWLVNEIRKAKGSVSELQNRGNTSNELVQANMDISKQEKVFRNNPDDVDNKMQVLSNLRKSLKVVDKLNDEKEWPDLEAQLKEEFYRLEKANSELGNERTTQVVHQLKGQLNEVIKVKDVKLGNVVLEEISTLFVHLTLVYQLIGFLRHHDENFNSYQWKDRSRARTLINQGLQKIGEQPDADVLHPVVISIIDLLPTDEQPSGDSSVLVK
jgi:molecular chaperone DnaK